MNNKEQIMIDGCNVSECLFYQSNFEEDYDVKIKHFCSNWHNSCESANNSNCYFKQLTRKTQECEQIKEKYEALKLENQEGYEIVAELKHEYEGLKKQLETAEEWRIKAESLNEKLELKNTCYLEALDEIEKELKEDIYCESQECGCDDFEECLKCVKTQILDIINKAKDGKQ